MVAGAPIRLGRKTRPKLARQACALYGVVRIMFNSVQSRLQFLLAADLVSSDLRGWRGGFNIEQCCGGEHIAT
jgi:hypothetical protein